MPKLTGRVIDYSQEEMLDMTGLERHQFRRDLTRVCEMYNFDIDCFKAEKGNKNSEFFFIPEVADLIAILLRNIDKHPLKRINAKIDDVSGTDIKKYYEAVLNDIDEEIHPSVAEAIYCLEGHLVAQNTVDWTERFAKQMTRFLVNLTTLKRQDIGESLRQFTQQLDNMNYYLYRGEYVLSLAYDSNIKEMQKYGMTDDEYSQNINKKLRQNNISIDRLIAEMIRWYLPKSAEIRESNFQEYVFDDNEMMRVIVGGNPNEASLSIQRELYYRLEVNYSSNKGLLENNQHILKRTRAKNAEWKDSAEKIQAGEFFEPHEKTVSEKIEIIEKNILVCEKQLEDYKQLLAKLKEKESEDEANEFLKEIQQEYVEHCKKTDSSYPELKTTVDKFVGRSIYELLKL